MFESQDFSVRGSASEPVSIKEMLKETSCDTVSFKNI